MILLLDFEAIQPRLLKNENLTFVSCCNNHLFLVPSMSSDPSSFWNLSNILQRFESILLYFE